MEEWWIRHSRDKKKEKGDVGAEVVREKEEREKLESFFCTAHEFLTDYAKFSILLLFLLMLLFPLFCQLSLFPLVLSQRHLLTIVLQLDSYVLWLA